MRHAGTGGPYNGGYHFAQGFAGGRFHHGFHGTPILCLVIGLAVIFLAWVFWKKLKKRKSVSRGIELPILGMDEPLAAEDAPFSQRAAILDEWEQSILKEDK